MATTQTLPSSRIFDDDIAPAASPIPARKPVLRRIYDAMIESQMRCAQFELDRTLGSGALRRMRAFGPPMER